ncbi:hypothetical protein BKA70DRAFT_1417340 [Coprinopsis sp. MPI-PUGE-AT-0042]|nr:hypothetical protein BKA70DRAFT_1447700 [Coprinopsis sp. MPI-PUGE-AT-0042]KAH6902503.1 hypothetical protein BKA70DRAFT_1434818 [Coprinopsis sp. MPI-PUGE-AT-0042]KAH6916559.1 hypothetical protein BKA70DRAFT_1417340 [Coprinopsis sp. MPI-PUGE-AT-0042]
MSNNIVREGSGRDERNEQNDIPLSSSPKTTREDEDQLSLSQDMPTEGGSQPLDTTPSSPETTPSSPVESQGQTDDDTSDSDSNIYTDISMSEDHFVQSLLRSSLRRRNMGSTHPLLEGGTSNPTPRRRPTLQLPQGPSIEAEYLMHGVPPTLAAWFGVTPFHPHIKAEWLRDACEAIQRDHGLCPDRDTREFITKIDIYFCRAPMNVTTQEGTGLPGWMCTRINTGHFDPDACLVLEVKGVMELGHSARVLERVRALREYQMSEKIDEHLEQGLLLTESVREAIYEDLPLYPSQVLKLVLSDGCVSFFAFTPDDACFNLAFFQPGTKVYLKSCIFAEGRAYLDARSVEAIRMEAHDAMRAEATYLRDALFKRMAYEQQVMRTYDTNPDAVYRDFEPDF